MVANIVIYIYIYVLDIFGHQFWTMDQLMGGKMGKHGKHGEHLHEMMVIVLRFQRNVLQAPGLWVQKDQPRTQAEIDSLWLGTWQNHGKNMEKSLENHWKFMAKSRQTHG